MYTNLVQLFGQLFPAYTKTCIEDEGFSVQQSNALDLPYHSTIPIALLLDHGTAELAVKHRCGGPRCFRAGTQDQSASNKAFERKKAPLRAFQVSASLRRACGSLAQQTQNASRLAAYVTLARFIMLPLSVRNTTSITIRAFI